MKLTYGNGTLHTQQAVTHDGVKCITIKQAPKAMPIGSTPAEWDKQTPEDEIDVILAFNNIEGARTLQDELNELIAIWSREIAEVV
jgi:hypothetical protein